MFVCLSIQADITPPSPTPSDEVPFQGHPLYVMTTQSLPVLQGESVVGLTICRATWKWKMLGQH